MKIVRGSEIAFEAAGHEKPLNPGVLKRVLATRDDFQPGHVQMLNWARLPAGRSFQAHYHEDMQEVFVILNGTVAITIDGQSHALHQGDAIIIDAREVHQMRNESNEDIEYLVFGIAGDRDGRTIVK